MHRMPDGEEKEVYGERGSLHGGSQRETLDGRSTNDAPSFQPIANMQHCGASTVGSCSEIGDAFEAIPHHGIESSAPLGGLLTMLPVTMRERKSMSAVTI